MTKIDASVLEDLPLADINNVTFYKRDELATDLIYCRVYTAGVVRTFHEEMSGWEALLQHLYKLPGFRTDWFASVSQPPFEESELVAFIR